MRRNFLLIVVILLFGIAVYFLGKKNGSNNVISSVVQNINLVEQIAELSALSVHGNTTAKFTNNDGSSAVWNKFKNYFTENTLQVNIPYEAKYGIELQNKKIKADTKNKKITLYLPECKLLSLELKLDKMETMKQTGLFSSTTIEDLSRVEKQIYQDAMQTLSVNANYKKQAALQITNILKNYYAPLGYEVVCIFDDKQLSQKQ